MSIILSDTSSLHILHACIIQNFHAHDPVQVSDVQDLQLYYEMDEAAFSECLGHTHLVNTIATDWRPKTVGVYRDGVCDVSYPWAERPRAGAGPLNFVTWERMIIMERMDGACVSFLSVHCIHSPLPTPQLHTHVNADSCPTI